MPQFDPEAVWAAAWPFVVGFFTGGLIGNIKNAVELWDRFSPSASKARIVVQSNLVSGSEYGDNLIFVTNLSDKPALLSYWEVVYREPFWHFPNRDVFIADGTEGPTRRIEPNEELVLRFSGREWFDPWPKGGQRSVVFRYVITGDRLRSKTIT